MSPSDADLISRALVYDDRHAFGELVKRHQSAIRGLLRRLTGGDEALADDLAQDTFIKAYKALARFNGQSKFGSWLYRIAYNTFLSYLRKKREVTGLGELPVDGVEPDRIREVSLRADLEQAMQMLSHNERAAIHLCYNEGHSHEEAARTLRMPLGTVKTHILRGKAKLKAELGAWRPS